MEADMKVILGRVNQMGRGNLQEIKWLLKANGEMENYCDLKNKFIMEDQYDFMYKIVLIGDSSVGKTNLFNRFVH